MEQDRGIADDEQRSELRQWSEPRLERLHVEKTRSGALAADEEVQPVTNPPS